MLAAVTLASCFVACNNENAGGTGAGEGNYEKWPDDLPLELNFKGGTVVILYPVMEEDPTYAPMSVESLTNDALNDAIYNRESAVEERLNVKLEFLMDADYENKARIAIQSNLDEYQIVGSARSTLGTEGLMTNLLAEERVPYLDLTKSYWSQLYNEEAQMYGQLYGATGALSMAYTKSMFNMFFNKEMVKQAGVENLYKVINNGDWTLDYMMALVENYYTDVTGNGKTDDDIYGLILDDARLLDAFWAGFDLTVCERDSEGNPTLSVDRDKMTKVVDTLRNMNTNIRGIYCLKTMELGEGEVGEDINIEKFARGEGMFLMANIYMTERKVMRDMTDAYGIIPLPKWDEYQKDYYSFNNAFDTFGIPTSCQDTARSSAVMEALASFSEMSVAPTYYDIILNGRYTRDLESSEMLDLMVKNVKLDFGWIYDWDIDKIAQNSLRYLVRDSELGFGTYWAQNRKRYEKKFEKLVDTYKAMAAAGA